MDLKQRKLKKSEWDSIEISVPKSELDVLNLITKGYHDVTTRVNNNHSILTFLKVEHSDKMENFIYNKFLRSKVERIEDMVQRIVPSYKRVKTYPDIKPNSADRIRLERFDEATICANDVYEMVLLTHLENLLGFKHRGDVKGFHFHYYVLYQLIRNNISHLNVHVKTLVHMVLDLFADDIDKQIVIENAVEFIERNQSLLKYGDLVLYEHQKEIFTLMKQPKPKLIMYMAPTGTGKTLTPIALSEQKKVIFVCVARHVGLALARAAISVRKRVAFAFGCASADDIRLHYFAAKEYTVNKRTGGIGKVDNSVGDNVEIIICDIKSYLPAMYYMLAFFDASDIVTYWDEPTITMDYKEHEFHATIRKNWKENRIPTVVLSSATLPKESELTETIPDFLNRFPGAEVCNIISHDCKKSIPIVNKDGFVVAPHYLCDNYDDMLQVAHHCKEYLTLLRYFDLKEVVDFITFVQKNQYASRKVTVERFFEDLGAINMKNIKMYYVFMLANIQPANWPVIYTHFASKREPRILENGTVDTKGNPIQKSRSVGPGTSVTKGSGTGLAGAPLSRLASEQMTSKAVPTIVGTSGAYVTTKDAYTLTDGPTIFISNDIEKIAKFCVQQANIPAIVMDEIMKKIEFNNVINAQIHEIETNVELIKSDMEERVRNTISSFHGGQKVSGRSKSNKDPKKLSKDVDGSRSGKKLSGREKADEESKKPSKAAASEEVSSKGALSKMTEEVNGLRAMIKRASLNDTFVPNKRHHLEKWAPDPRIPNAFTSSIDEQVVADIMALNGVDNLWKVLLMMGIGVFINHENITYTEIMKKLADEQRLYMIIASSDYIYGTNYQFCHGFLSKDLDLTQEKVIQAMGRIGRNNVQQTYTVRFRDDAQIAKLFTSNTDKPEVINMNILFNSKKVIYQDGMYTEVEDDDVEEEEDEELLGEHLLMDDEEEEFEVEDDEEDEY